MKWPNTPGIKMQKHKKVFAHQADCKFKVAPVWQGHCCKGGRHLEKKVWVENIRRSNQNVQKKDKCFCLSDGKGDVDEVALQGEVGDPVDTGDLKNQPSSRHCCQFLQEPMTL